MQYSISVSIFNCFIPCSLTLLDISDYNTVYERFQILRTPQVLPDIKATDPTKDITFSQENTTFNKTAVLVVEDDPIVQI